MIQKNHFVASTVLLLVVPAIVLTGLSPVFGDTTAPPSEDSPWQDVPANGVIETSGKFVLHNDMLVDRKIGIEVRADNVTIDLGGHALRFTGVPKAGVFGIVAHNRTGVTISNGAVGGFWFNVHCTENERLRIRDVHFDDIPYIGINAADSKDVAISDNRFENFRYDLPRDEKSHYVVAINIGAKDAVITNNRFIAKPQMAAKEVDIETVFVLFSANVTKACVVAKNDMAASDVMRKSYAIWVATNAQVAIVDNTIRDMLFGVTLGSDASALVCFNRFQVSADADAPSETIGINAPAGKEVVASNNTFEGVNVPTALPTKTEGGG